MDSPSQITVDAELWSLAEQRAEQIINCVQPNKAADKKREEILVFLKNLIGEKCGSEFFPFGSMPLRVYLPDGDIDITALIPKSKEEDLANKLVTFLENQQHGGISVCDVQYIRAQVEIVKCSINDIAVDISFNQLAGLSTLCFLEKVDQIIGKAHLFKRSVLLIKSWCYYESRILGAHHGLLSTYGLEVLILCVINLFHSSLHGPLEVLHRFLEYYSKFDWENYAVSLNGPVPKTLLSGTVEKPGSAGDKSLLSAEFLQNCCDIFSVSVGAPDNGPKVFPIKFVNIVDPLRDQNNLGRCVNQGNFYRIRCALNFGLRKFKEIILHPGETMCQSLENFFLFTLERNGRGQRPDVEVPISAFGTGKSDVSELRGDYDKYYNWLLYSQQYHKKIDAHSQPTTSPSPFHARGDIVMGTPYQPQYKNAFCYPGAEPFVPRMPLCYANSTNIDATAGYPHEIQRSRGTGTYIPDINQLIYRERHSSVAYASDLAQQHSNDAHLSPGHAYKETRSGIKSSYKEKHSSTHRPNREMYFTSKEQNSAAVTRTAAQCSQKKSKAIDVSLQSENKTFDLSLNEFPLLQGTVKPKTSAEVSPSSLPDVHQSQHFSRHLKPVEFGSVRQALSSELSSLLMDKLAASSATTAVEASRSWCSSKIENKREGLNPKAKPFTSLNASASSTADAIPGVSKWGVPKRKEEQDQKATRYIPWSLENDKEYPPLPQVNRVE